jgi:hypothetical protein
VGDPSLWIYFSLTLIVSAQALGYIPSTGLIAGPVQFPNKEVLYFYEVCTAVCRGVRVHAGFHGGLGDKQIQQDRGFYKGR